MDRNAQTAPAELIRSRTRYARRVVRPRAARRRLQSQKGTYPLSFHADAGGQQQAEQRSEDDPHTREPQYFILPDPWAANQCDEKHSAWTAGKNTRKAESTTRRLDYDDVGEWRDQSDLLWSVGRRGVKVGREPALLGSILY